MIFQFIIIVTMVALLAYGVSQRKRSHIIAGSIILVALAGFFLGLFPDILQKLAHRVGIGRGADLMFYIFTLSVLMMLANIHVRMRRFQDITTALARELALTNVRRSSTNDDS